jgi:hypothetical protein
MNKLKQMSVGKQVLLMFGTLCAILGLIGGLLFFSPRSIERSGREQLSYIVDDAELVAAAAQNIGLMPAMIFSHILASTPEEKRLHDPAPFMKWTEKMPEKLPPARNLWTPRRNDGLTPGSCELGRNKSMFDNIIAPPYTRLR